MGLKLNNMSHFACTRKSLDKVYLSELCLTPEIRFKRTHPDAVLPTSNNSDITLGDTGYDLTAVEDTLIKPYSVGRSGSEIVPVGLTLAYIETGFWFRIEPRSGLGFKHHLQPHLGVIDNGYRGDLGVKLYNFGHENYRVKKGDRIAQFVVYPLIQPQCEWADEIVQSNRGADGLGSSGK